MTIQMRMLTATLVVLCGALSGFGQSTEGDITAKLKDKPLYLRGGWRDEDLRFDSEGKLVDRSDPISLTLSGFNLRSVKLKQTKLVLKGKRVGLAFIKNTATRIPLDSDIKIEIASPANGDFGPALDAVFADGLPALIPSMPSYWQKWAKLNLLPQPAGPLTELPKTPEEGVDDQWPRQVGGAVSPPRLKAHRGAEFNEIAIKIHYSGTTLIGMVVTKEGLPTNLSIIKPIGLGLDEQALASVEAYRFSPAIMNGEPVPVEVNIEVNFAIF